MNQANAPFVVDDFGAHNGAVVEGAALQREVAGFIVGMADMDGNGVGGTGQALGPQGGDAKQWLIVNLHQQITGSHTRMVGAAGNDAAHHQTSRKVIVSPISQTPVPFDRLRVHTSPRCADRCNNCGDQALGSCH